jgi:hypothetical protein
MLGGVTMWTWPALHQLRYVIAEESTCEVEWAISYCAEFKLKFILYADENGKWAAAWQFDVHARDAIKKVLSFWQNTEIWQVD